MKPSVVFFKRSLPRLCALGYFVVVYVTGTLAMEYSKLDGGRYSQKSGSASRTKGTASIEEPSLTENLSDHAYYNSSEVEQFVRSLGLVQDADYLPVDSYKDYRRRKFKESFLSDQEPGMVEAKGKDIKFDRRQDESDEYLRTSYSPHEIRGDERSDNEGAYGHGYGYGDDGGYHKKSHGYGGYGHAKSHGHGWGYDYKKKGNNHYGKKKGYGHGHDHGHKKGWDSGGWKKGWGWKQHKKGWGWTQKKHSGWGWDQGKGWGWDHSMKTDGTGYSLLGGLAFLTYLGVLVNQILMNNPNFMGREDPEFFTTVLQALKVRFDEDQQIPRFQLRKAIFEKLKDQKQPIVAKISSTFSRNNATKFS